MKYNIRMFLAQIVAAWLALQVARLLYNVFLHPLRSYPGPLDARSHVQDVN